MKRRLLYQLGLFISVLFVISSFIGSYFVFKKGTEWFLKAKEEGIEKDIGTFKDIWIYNKVSYYVFTEIWTKYPEIMKKDTDDTDYEISEKVYNSIGDKSESDLDYDFYNSLTTDEIIALSHVDYNYYNLEFMHASVDMPYEESFVIQKNENNDFVFLFISGIFENSINVYDLFDASITDTSKYFETEYLGKQYVIGDIYNVTSVERDALMRIYSDTNDNSEYVEVRKDETGKEYYICYSPIRDDEGKVTSILCVVYDWSDVYSDMVRGAIRTLIVTIVIGLLLIVGLILIFVNYTAIKPLSIVKHTLRDYMVTKNSSDVEERLQKVAAKNEIGDLADDVNNLAKEIDRYTDEIVDLVTVQEKMSSELSMASKIQNEVLLKDFPKTDNFEIFASMVPAKQVGGDFYDFFYIGEDHLGLVVADVSDKGFPAALLMMAAMTAIKNFSLMGGSPADILGELNEELVRRDISDMFVTVWMGILDINTGVLEAANAGHEYPIIYNDGSFKIFKDPHGFVVGGMGGLKYQNYKIQLKKGDSIFLYTDGIAEANNKDKELFGINRIEDALNISPDSSPEELINNINIAISEYVGDTEQFDDMTMLCLKYFG